MHCLPASFVVHAHRTILVACSLEITTFFLNALFGPSVEMQYQLIACNIQYKNKMQYVCVVMLSRIPNPVHSCGLQLIGSVICFAVIRRGTALCNADHPGILNFGYRLINDGTCDTVPAAAADPWRCG